MLSHDRYRDVNGDGYPDLGVDGVGGGAVERLDSEVLLDVLEEELHLAALTVEFRYDEGGECEVIGQERELLARLGVAVTNTAQRFRIGFGGL